ncbi:MAG: hypothetical protein Q7S73_00435 [bacterium]|nr:hypothetical protein [bacterium]
MAKEKHPAGKLIDDPKLIFGTTAIDLDDEMAQKFQSYKGDVDKLTYQHIGWQMGPIPYSLLAETMCPLEFAMIPEAPFHLKAFGMGLDASHLK